MTTAREDETSALEFYQRYFTCFQQLDLESVRGYFAPTLFRVANGQIAVFASPREVGGFVQGLVARLIERGYRGARTDELSASVLDACTALIRSRGRRYDRAGHAFETFDVLYTLVRPAAGREWAIGGITSLRTAP